jgi:2-dehydropantoate 2-reductase
MEPRSASVAILGAGAVGCFFGSMLAKAGIPTRLIGRATHVDAIRRDGLVIDRATGRESVRIEATTDVDVVRAADIVLVCVKSQDSESAARELAPRLQRDAVVASLQNGVDNADRIARSVDNVVLAAVVYVGTSMEGPGIVWHAGRGDLVLGIPRRVLARPDARAALQRVAALFERAGVPCPVSTDVEAALWSKLTTNCALNAVSALGRARYGRIMATAELRSVLEDAVRESVTVANAEGVSLDMQAMIDTVWRVANGMSTQYSSTAQDILRGRRTEIDALNGFVAERARAHGIDTPVNRTLHALVKLRESGDDLA